MQIQTTKLPGSQMDLTFQLDSQDVQRAFDKVYQELGNQPVPGFRPGHVPPAVIRRRFKPEVLREVFWLKAIETFVEPELEKEEWQIIGRPEMPEFEGLEVQEGQGVEFTIKVTVKPQPELPDYKSLKLYRVPPVVTEEQIEEVLEQMRQAAAKEKPVKDRPVQAGDIVSGELKITLAGQEEPIHESSQTLEVGSGRYTPAIDEALLGHQLDETVSLEYEYPEDYEEPELAGQKATITMTIEEIRERQLPPLDDDFARSQGDYENLAALRAAVRERLTQEAEKRSQENLENDALAAILAETKIDLPEILVEELAQRNFESFVEELQANGMSLQEFAQIAQTDAESLQQNARARAELALKVQFILEAIARAEDVKVSEEDIEQELALFAQEANVEENFARQALELQPEFRERLAERAQRRLTIQKILETAVIEDVSEEKYRQIKEQQRQAAQEKAEAAAKESEGKEEETEAGQAAESTDITEATEPAATEAECAPEASQEATAGADTEAQATSDDAEVGA